MVTLLDPQATAEAREKFKRQAWWLLPFSGALLTWLTSDLLRAGTQHVVYRRRAGLVHMDDEPVTFWVRIGLYGLLWAFLLGLPRYAVWKAWLQTQRHGWLAAYSAQSFAIIGVLGFLAGLDVAHPARPLIWMGLALVFALDLPIGIWIGNRMRGQAKC